MKSSPFMTPDIAACPATIQLPTTVEGSSVVADDLCWIVGRGQAKTNLHGWSRIWRLDAGSSPPIGAPLHVLAEGNRRRAVGSRPEAEAAPPWTAVAKKQWGPAPPKPHRGEVPRAPAIGRRRRCVRQQRRGLRGRGVGIVCRLGGV